jgi:hypothetical protein
MIGRTEGSRAIREAPSVGRNAIASLPRKERRGRYAARHHIALLAPEALLRSDRCGTAAEDGQAERAWARSIATLLGRRATNRA